MSDLSAKELFEKGIEYFNAKELPLAEKYFEKALKLEPERISILENLALVYFSNEKFEISENILNKIIKLEKDSPRVFNLMLKALKKQDKIKELKLYLDKELNQKNLQGCSHFIFSRLFKTSYKSKKGFMGVIKFNLFKLSRKENLIPLGGINLSNLNKMIMVNCNAFAVLSEIKKKPVKIFNRLF